VLAACLGLPLVARAGRAAVAPLIDSADLLIAGPSGGRLDRVAGDLLPALVHGLPAGTLVQPTFAGGPDGVTGANRFEARGAPDGNSILLMPGEAALAWLVGDPRARFNAGMLVPVMAGVAPGVLMSRVPLDGSTSAARLHVAAGRPDGPELAGLLALDLLGLRPVSTFGYTDPATITQAIQANGADATFVVGPDARQRVGRLARAGLSPAFVLGVPGPDRTMLRDPQMPDVPTLPELVVRLHGRPPAGPLYDAWRAVSVSAQLTFLLALPALTPAALVSLWRQAAIHAAAVIPPAAATGLRMLPCPETTEFTAPLAAANTATLIELRRWLATRLGWQPA
jgi:hypothetical protein